MSDDALRPVTGIVFDGLAPGQPATDKPIIEWMAPGDLLVNEDYQRDLGAKSMDLIRRIVTNWDWRRFKPPVVAWTERGFEIIDGQHTAIAAASHPLIDKIPVLVVEAPDQTDRAKSFIGHNRDRLTVSAMQLHHAAVAAGDDEAVTIEQVCSRAGVRLLRSAYGGIHWSVGDTVAIGAIGRLIDRRGAMRARQVLEVLVKAERAPIVAGEIRAVEHLLTEPEYSSQVDAEAITAVIIAHEGAAESDARIFAKAHCVPMWKALAAVWFRKARKKRAAAA